MRPIVTPATNHNFAPPEGQEDTIGDLPCHFEDEDWGRVVWSEWEPTPTEREAIAKGHNLRLGIGWLGAFPPVYLGTVHLKEITPADAIEHKS